MSTSRQSFLLVLLQVHAKYLGSMAQESVAATSEMNPFDGCPSLLQVDVARSSQVQKINADSSQHNDKLHEQSMGVHIDSQESKESKDSPGGLHTHDLLKHTSVTGVALGQDGQAPSLGANRTLNGVDPNLKRAQFLQKPYLELYIYFDALLLVLALLIFFVLPQALGAGGSGSSDDERHNLPAFLPALSSLRYLAIVTVWLKHHWVPQLFNTSEFVLMLSGFVLEYAEQRKTKDEEGPLQLRYKQFLPRRFARLYPLYALHVIIGHLTNKSLSCDPVRALLLYQSWGYGTGFFAGGKLVYSSCGIGTWFVSVIFGCYFLFPIMSRPLRNLPTGGAAVLWIACSIFVVLPRAFASPAGAPKVWWNDVFHPEQNAVGLVELLISQKSLLHGLAHFFMGMLLSRCWACAGLLSNSTGLVHRICTNGCIIGTIALGVQWVTITKHPSMVRNGYGARFLSEVWKVIFQSVVLLGAAGPSNPAHCLSDPVRWVLSFPWIAWMGELALPLYLTTTWACDFSDKFMLHVGVARTGSSSQAAYFVAQLVLTHLIAFTIYQSCGALTSRAIKQEAK